MKIYKIEEAGKGWIGHWFYFMVTAFSNIPEFGKEKIGVCFDREDWTSYQTETFDILKNYIELVPNTTPHIFIPSVKMDNRAKNNSGICHIEPRYFHFLRNLFLSEIENLKIDGFDKVYIRRNKCHLSLGNAEDTLIANIKRRQILEEDELVERLEDIGFTCINLEDYSVSDKIRIFHSASVILGPNGAGMTFLFAAKFDVKYIEIVTTTPRWQYIDYYLDVCNTFGLNFNRYSDVKLLDSEDNISINIEEFIDYLIPVISST